MKIEKNRATHCWQRGEYGSKEYAHRWIVKANWKEEFNALKRTNKEANWDELYAFDGTKLLPIEPINMNMVNPRGKTENTQNEWWGEPNDRFTELNVGRNIRSIEKTHYTKMLARTRARTSTHIHRLHTAGYSNKALAAYSTSRTDFEQVFSQRTNTRWHYLYYTLHISCIINQRLSSFVCVRCSRCTNSLLGCYWFRAIAKISFRLRSRACR